MQKSTNNQFRLHAICPQCGDLVEVEFIINTKFTEAEPETKPEEKDNAETKTGQEIHSGPAESGSVRPDRKEGELGAADQAARRADSEKGTGNKKTGGKAK